MNNSDLISHLYNFFWLISAALVAPFYVCAGFSLYLQRRIDLEAWDIEIQFRRLAQRKSAQRHKLTLPALVLAAASLSFMSSYSPVTQAQTDLNAGDSIGREDSLAVKEDDAVPNETESVEKKAAAQAINAIFESEDFRNIDQRSGFRPIPEEDEDDGDEIPEWLITLVEWLENGGAFFQALGEFFLWLAKFIEVILWVLVIGLIAFFVYHYRAFIMRVFDYQQDDKITTAPPPKTLFGLDVTEDSLPEDVVDAAQKSWAQGDQRMALALLMRGSIVKCMDMRCDFVSGNTEKECAQIVRQSLQTHQADYFSALVKHWQARAYAHKSCKPEVFDALCRRWREVFMDE